METLTNVLRSLRNHLKIVIGLTRLPQLAIKKTVMAISIATNIGASAETKISSSYSSNSNISRINNISSNERSRW